MVASKLSPAVNQMASGDRVGPVTPFDDQGGIWLRCALHAHTTNSDGDMPPDKLVQHYERAGYDVLAITDHWVRTVERSTRRLLVIPSAELNATCGGSEEDAHVLALGVEADPAIPENEFAPLQEVVAWILENGGVPYLAHTYWSGLRTDQWDTCTGLVGIEIWNAGCELEIGRGDSAVHWDEALERRRLLWGIAADDSHHPGFDSGFAWTMVRVPERTQEGVLDALRTGRFYASTGPAIESVAMDEAAVVVECSPATSVTLVSSRARGARANAGRLGYGKDSEILACDANGLITAVRLERPYDVPYGRIEVTAPAGGRAWTNPLWIAATA
jgi:hypothetical protein